MRTTDTITVPPATRVKCITVVIPTILKTSKEVFQYTLDQLNDSDLVDKIIIIDNTENKDFDKQYPVTVKTLVLKTPGNLGASYNSGMAHCQTKYYLLLNDDVLCHKRVLDDCYNVMESDEGIGLLQMRTVNYQPLAEYLSAFVNETQPTQYWSLVNPRKSMTGWFQFGRKCDWIDIPKELKFFFGDDLLLMNMEYKGLKVVQVASSHISHMMSTSVNALGISHQMHGERAFFNDLVQKLFPKRAK